MEQNGLTPDQRRDVIKRVDDMADGIMTSATALSGLNGLGLWAGGVKAVSLLNAAIYVIPILLLGIAALCALWVKYPQWDMNLQTYNTLLTKKQERFQYAVGSFALGIIMLVVALLVYTVRTFL